MFFLLGFIFKYVRGYFSKISANRRYENYILLEMFVHIDVQFTKMKILL